MATKFPDGRPGPNKPKGDAEPAETLLKHGSDAVPATTLSGAFKAALGKSAQKPQDFVPKAGGKAHNATPHAGPLNGPAAKPRSVPTAFMPRKGHR